MLELRDIKKSYRIGDTVNIIDAYTMDIHGEAKEILARCGDIPIYTASFDVLTQLTGFKLTRGMLCAMRRKELPAMEDILKWGIANGYTFEALTPSSPTAHHRVNN